MRNVLGPLVASVTRITGPIINHWGIGIDDNSTPVPYARNVEVKLGGWADYYKDWWEVLFVPDFRYIPSGKTFDSVTIDVNVLTNSYGEDLECRYQSRGAWIDTGSSSPLGGTAPFDESEDSSVLSSVSLSTGQVGVVTIPDSYNLRSKLEDMYDGTASNDGLILTYWTSSLTYGITIDDIKININYS